MTRVIGGSFLLAALWMAAAPAAHALDHQVHGFAAQGLVQSEGNDFYGDSTNGSLSYYEAGINGSLNLGHGFLVAAQGVIRDAGRTDTGKPRLDYALVDFEAVQGPRYSAGIRAGRVKNPYGLYNDTRDVVFTRPGILLPQSIYFDGQGLRSLFFSSDGGQLYGNFTAGDHELGLVASAAVDRDLDREDRIQLVGNDDAVPSDVRLSDLGFVRLRDDWSGGKVTLAASYAHGTLSVHATPTFPLEAEATFNLYLLSARYNAASFSFTAEYGQRRGKTRSNFMVPPSQKTISDGGYVQADWRLSPQWTVYGRLDSTFNNIHDRKGHDFEDAGLGNRDTQFAHDLTAGVNWRSAQHWGVWLEGHVIHGLATVPALDNEGGADDNHWSLWTIMAAYHF